MDQNEEPVRKTVERVKLPYKPPAIVWEEDYRPTAFGLSCYQAPGNPQCIPLVSA